MPPSPLNSTRLNTAYYLAIGSLLIIHGWLSLSASTYKSTTNDEIAHITGGYTYNQFNDFRVQPENGILPQRWHALPLGWTEPNYPDFNGYPWTQGLAYQVSYDFFYRADNDPQDLLFAGRAMNLFWGLAVLVVVASVTRQFFGVPAAIFSTAMAALSPTLLAHSALATSDMSMAFFFLVSTIAFWRHLNSPNLRTFILSSTIFGLACVAKFSAVMLLPMMAIMIAIRSMSDAPVPGVWSRENQWYNRVTNLTGWWIGHGLVAMVVIWAFYGFRFAMMSPELPEATMPLAWSNILSNHPGWEPIILTLRDIRILPEAFLYGFSYVLAFSLARGAFLDGRLGTEGWVDFFPRTFLYKSTPGEILSLLLVTFVFFFWLRKRDEGKLKAVYRWTPGIVLFVVYWAFSLTSHLNIGHRHILPTYPLLFIAFGSIVWGFTRAWSPAPQNRKIALILSGSFLLAQVVSVASIHPHHLAYFNALSGGPAHGYKHLVDSSLDWGQDLPGLADYLETHGALPESTYLAYFGTGEPTHYGIEANVVKRLPKFDSTLSVNTLLPGTYAISATLLQHVYQQRYQPWTSESEQLYQSLRNITASISNGQFPDVGLPTNLDGVSEDEFKHAWTIYDELRFARLCVYLKVRPPEAMIGYSILVFELNQSELEAVLHGDLGELLKAMEQVNKLPFNPNIY